MPHSVLAVANEFISDSLERDVPLTPMHLQKLCYLAHGYALAFLNDDLIGDAVQAWDYGPVYPALYDALKAYGSGAVTELIHENNWASSPSIRGDIVREEFTEDEDEIMEGVFETYAAFPAFKLSALTHEEGSPWHEMYAAGHRNVQIPTDRMKEYFRGLTAP